MHRFDYVAPRSLDETLATLNHWGADARLLAGGTDLLVQMKEGRRTPRCVVSLHHLPGIAGIRAEDGGLWIGARTTMAEVSEHLMAGAVLPGYLGLAEGAGLVGSIQIRNLATVGGNLCNAAPSADVAPPLMTLGARAIIAGPGGQKSMSLEDFFRGPGQTALEPTQLLLGVRVPAPVARSGSAYLRHTPRAWMDIAVVGVGAWVALDETGACREARIVLGAVAPTPIRAPAAEAALRDRRLTDGVLAEAAQQAAAASRPISDIRASAEYRRHLVGVLAKRAIRAAWMRAQGIA